MEILDFKNRCWSDFFLLSHQVDVCLCCKGGYPITVCTAMVLVEALSELLLIWTNARCQWYPRSQWKFPNLSRPSDASWNLVNIGLGIGLSPVPRQAITWTSNADNSLLSVRPSTINFSEILAKLFCPRKFIRKCCLHVWHFVQVPIY